MISTRWVLAILVLLAPQAAAQSLDFQVYRTRVEPIFLKVREANGPGGSCFSCHTHVNTRLRLQPVTSSLTWTEAQSRRNFEAVQKLVVPGDPAKSRLLLQPLATQAGGNPVHAGGKHWQSQNDPEWQAIAAWVKAAAAQPPAAAPALNYETYKTRVQPLLLSKRSGLARCYTCHSQGTNFRLQPLSAGMTQWNEEQTRKNFDSIQRVVVPGEPLNSRLLMMPLASESGGDPFHPGGKHWSSQNDPEWQAIASWIRGR
jgi:hypothetical protein